LFTDFVDTVTAELLIESMQRMVGKHVVVFVTQRGSVLRNAVDAAPRQFSDVAEAVIAHDFLRERSIVFERLERLGVHCIDVPSRGLPGPLTNCSLLTRQRGLIRRGHSPRWPCRSRTRLSRESRRSSSKAASSAKAARKAGSSLRTSSPKWSAKA